MDLEPDHRLPAGGGLTQQESPRGVEADRLLEREGGVEEPFSENAGPAIWKPTGRPPGGPLPSPGFASPAGIETAGMPASDIGTVQ